MADRDVDTRIVRCVLAKQVAPADGGGEATFERPRGGGKWKSRFFWRTRLATPDDLRVGALVVYPSLSRADAIPLSRDQALSADWELSRVIGLEDLAKGKVLVTGVAIVAAGKLRVVEGDATSIAIASPEDRHFLHDEHWLVWADPASAPPTDPKEPVVLRLALALAAPKEPGGEGVFVLIHSGQRVVTSYAVRTRAASAADLQVGARVALCHDNSSRSDGPSRRADALSAPWLVGPITKMGQGSGTCYVGDWSARPQGVRVVVP